MHSQQTLRPSCSLDLGKKAAKFLICRTETALLHNVQGIFWRRGSRKHQRQRRSYCSLQASREKSAESDDSDEPPSSWGSWTARFLPDTETREQTTDQSTPEDPRLVQMAKEKFWGRIAVISLGAVLISERLSGKGIVTALNMATGVPVWEIEPALGLLVGGLTAAALYPIIRTYLQRASDAAARGEKKKLILIRTLGDSFQVTTGRLALLVLAGTILAEATTGKGILALLNIKTGVEITEIEAGLTFLLLLLFTEDMVSATKKSDAKK